MYAALWRLLPGPAWVRALECLVLLVLLIWVLFTWVFPAISPSLPFTDNTVGAAAPHGRAPWGT